MQKISLDKKFQDQKDECWCEFTSALCMGKPEDYTGILRSFFYAYHFGNEVSMDGYREFFDNCQDFNFDEISPALQELGLDDYAALFLNALDVFKMNKVDRKKHLIEIEDKQAKLPDIMTRLNIYLSQNIKNLIRFESKHRIPKDSIVYQDHIIHKDEIDAFIELKEILGDYPETDINSGHVIELYIGHEISDTKSISEFPESIKKLKFLTYINIGKNIVLKTIPEIIFTFTGLQYLLIENLKTLPSEICKLKSLKELSLTDGELELIPENIGQLSLLKKLSLKKNKIKSLPESIGDLYSLKYCDVSYNKLTKLPESIGNLKKIKHFNITNNALESIPERFGDLENLDFFGELNFENNMLTSLPNSLKNLDPIYALNLKNNRFISIPESIQYLNSLYFIDASDNTISIFPNNTTIKVLKLDNNQIKTLPESLQNLKSLESLYLQNNQLTTLPDWIANLPLKYLELTGNKFSTNHHCIERLCARGCKFTF